MIRVAISRKDVLALIYVAKLDAHGLRVIWEPWGPNTYRVRGSYPHSPEFIYLVTPTEVFDWRLR